MKHFYPVPAGHWNFIWSVIRREVPLAVIPSLFLEEDIQYSAEEFKHAQTA
jgi:hypothetical protein